MKNRMIPLVFAALLSLGAVACEGGTATDDGTAGDPAGDPAVTDPGADPLGGAVDDGTGDM